MAAALGVFDGRGAFSPEPPAQRLAGLERSCVLMGTEIEEAQRCLDDHDIPRRNRDGERYSLAERVLLLARQVDG